MKIENGGNTAIITKLEEVSVNIKDFGAVSDAKYFNAGRYYIDSGYTSFSTDNTAAIQRAVDYVAGKGGGNVFIPRGQFLVKSVITLKNKVNLVGIKGSSFLVADGSFVPGSRSAIISNEHYALTYNANSADTFKITDLGFKLNNELTNALITGIAIANTNGVTIEGCTMDFTKGYCLGIYVYSCNWSISILNNTITNLSNFDNGGCVWVSNVGTDGVLGIYPNITYDVLIQGNTLTGKCGAETLAVYGRDSFVNKVRVCQNNISVKYTAGDVIMGKAVAFFGRTGYTSTSGSGLKDVIFSENTIDVEEISSCVISTGSSYSETDVMEDILIINNTIRMKTEVASNPTALGIYVFTCPNYKNVIIDGNVITNYGTNPCKAGIYNALVASHNSVTGVWSQASISQCDYAVDNTVVGNTAGAGTAGIYNCNYTLRNKIKGCLVGIRIAGTTTSYDIKNNIIDMIDDASSYGIYMPSTSPTAFVDGNTINTVNASSRAFSFCTGSFITLLNNAKTGPGAFITNYVVLQLADNNRIDDSGNYDIRYNGRLNIPNIETSLPIGHIVMDSTLTWPDIGWRKVAAGSGIDKWQIYRSSLDENVVNINRFTSSVVGGDWAPAFRAAIDYLITTYGGGTLVAPAETYNMGSYVNIPVGITFDGCGSTFVPMPTGTFTNNFIFGINSANATTWDVPYNTKYTEIRNFTIYNSENIVDIKGIFVAGSKTSVRNIKSSGMYQTIKKADHYIDMVTIDTIDIENPKGTEYHIDTGSLGDGLAIQNCHMHDVAGNGNYNMIRTFQCNGANIERIINGVISITDSNSIKLSALHIEFGALYITSSAVSVDDSSFWRFESGSLYPHIIIQADNYGHVSNVSLKNIIFNYLSTWNYAVDSYDVEFVSNRTGTVDMVNVLRSCVVIGNLNNRSYAGIACSLNGADFTTFNKFSQIYSVKCSIVNDGTILTPISSAVSDNVNSMLDVITLTTVAGTSWTLPTGTYYYRAIALLDLERMIGYSTNTAERSVVIAGISALPNLMIWDYKTSKIRLYRGTASGQYNRYVDIPLINFGDGIRDDGVSVCGYRWKSRTVGGIDTLYSARMLTHDNSRCIVRSDTNAAPTIGTWIQGDKIDRYPKLLNGYYSSGFECIASGTPGTWRSNETRGMSVNVLDFGAVPDGSIGNTAAIQAAIDYVALNGLGTVVFPAGQYKANGHIILKNGVRLEGVPGKTIIFADNDVAVSGPAGWIESYTGTGFNYDTATACSISMYGITFDWRCTRALRTIDLDPHDMLRLANIDRAVIEKCSFLALVPLPNQGVDVGMTLLNLSGNWKNVTIRDCEFKLLSGALTGGCLWIRNYSTSNTISENFLMENCSFEKLSCDEIIAVFTSKYDMRNVKIRDCTFNHKSSASVISNTGFSIYATEAEDVLTDVEMSGCKFNIDDFKYSAVMINSLGALKNINVHHNDLYVKSTVANPETNNNAIVSCTVGAGLTDVSINNNNFYAASGASDIKFGLMRVPSATGNYIEGPIRTGLYNCDYMADNIFISNSTHTSVVGIQSPKKAINNTIKSVDKGIVLQCADGDDIRDGYCRNNKIYLKDASGVIAIYCQVLAGRTFAAKYKFMDNYFETINAGTRWFNMENMAWTIDMINNIFNGPGSTFMAVGAPAFNFISNNNWNGYNDTYATALPTSGSGLLGLLPVGHMITNPSAKWPELGWRKASTGSTADKFLIIRVSTEVDARIYGVAGDGTTDDTTAIQAAINAVSTAGGGTLSFPKGQFKCTNTLTLKNNVMLKGIPGLSVIFIDNSYVGTTEGWIKNEHSSSTYNDATADTILLYGMTFEKRTTVSVGSKTVMLLNNIKKAHIDNCRFIHDTNIGTAVSVESSLLDLYCAWKNVLIENSYFSLTPDTTAGGCMWVRNLTTDTTAGNISENLLVTNCTFKKKTHDEILAIFTTSHSMKNIKFINNNFHMMKSTSVTPIVVGIRASQVGHELKDVEISGNKFTVDDYNYMIVEYNIGSGVCRNIKVSNNEFYVNTDQDPATNNIFLTVMPTDSLCYNTSLEENTFYITASNSYYVETGVYGKVDLVRGNNIEGPIARGFMGCKIVEDNYFNNTVPSLKARGAESCETVTNNEFRGVFTGLHYQYSANNSIVANASKNKIYLVDIENCIAIYFQSIAAAFVAAVKLSNNYIESINFASRGIQIDPVAVWRIALISNIFKGPCTAYRLSGASTIEFAQNNDWNEYNDSHATVLPSGASGLLNALPVGHFIQNISPAWPELGWKKVVDGSTQNEWKSVESAVTIEPSGADDTDAIQNALDTYGFVNLSAGTFLVSRTIYPKAYSAIRGKHVKLTTIKYSGTGYCFNSYKVGDTWISNITFEDLTISGEFNTVSDGGIFLGNTNTSVTYWPFDFNFNNVLITGFKGANSIGLYAANVSGLKMINTKIERIGGANSICLYLQCLNINTGVDTFQGCSFGDRTDSNISVKIRSEGNVFDSAVFSGCYFGGKKTLVIENIINSFNLVRALTFDSCHFEKLDVIESHSSLIYIYAVTGCDFNNCMFGGDVNTNHVFAFNGTRIYNLNINHATFGSIVNEGIYAIDGVAFFNCQVNGLTGFSGSYSGGITFVNTNDLSVAYRDTTTLTGKEIIYGTNTLLRLKGTTFIVCDLDGNDKRIAFHYQTPTTGTWRRGDIVFMSNPTVGQPKGWVCTGGGTPGTWVSMGNL